MKQILPLLLWLCASGHVSSQGSYFLQTYTSKSGLPDNNVRCLARDDNGYLWIGTESGLSRFDGTRFLNFKSWRSDSTTLSSNSVYDLFVDSRKRLWIAAWGMNLYHPETGKFSRIESINHLGTHHDAVEVFSIYEDRKGRILICTPYVGLQVYDESSGKFNRWIKRAKNSKGKEIPLPVSITSVIQDSDGIYWMLNYSQLYRYDESKEVLDEFPCMLTGSSTGFQSLKVFEDLFRTDQLWISTWGDGLVCFNKNSRTFRSRLFETDFPKNLKNIVMSLFQPDSSALWVGTNDGIKLMNSATLKYTGEVSDMFSSDPLINYTMINCIYKDPEGIIWTGTSSGLSAIHPEKQSFTRRRLASHHRSFFTFSSKTKLIYATEYYRDRAFVTIHPVTGVTNKYPLPGADTDKAEPFFIAETPDTSLWIGTTKRIYQFRFEWGKARKAEIILTDGNKIIDPRVTDMLTDTNGDLWISCRGFLLRKKKEADFFEQIDSVFSVTGTFTLHDIELLAELPGEGTILYSAVNDLIFLDDAGQFKKQIALVNPNGDRISQITDMESGGRGDVWITTTNNGLIYVDSSNQISIYRYDYLGNQLSDLSGLSIDNNLNPWFVSGQKIYTVTPETNKIMFYSGENGLPLINRNTNLESFADGSVVYNISQGLFAFNPESLKRVPQSLQVSLYRIVVNGTTLKKDTIADICQFIQLNHDHNNIVFDFVAKNFLSPYSTVYSFILEGVQDQWSTPSPVGLIGFNQLAPGTYRLKIKAGSPDIPVNAGFREITIMIRPAWYQTSAFKIFVVLLLIGILIFITRFLTTLRYKAQIVSMNHQREIEQIRSRISRDIHDEIGAGLTKIKLLSRKILKSGDRTVSDSDTRKVADTTDELIKNLGEIVWTINPENDSLENIVAYIRMYLSNFSEEHTECSIQLDLPQPEAVPRMTINPQIKRNLLLILKEAINNTIKHSRSTIIKVGLQINPDKLLLSVSDNGTGFGDDAFMLSGNGLKNMKKRALAVNGILNLTSGPSGTDIELTVPLVTAGNLL